MTQPIANGIYIIQSAINWNNVLDIDFGHRHAGARVQLWNKSGASNQTFILNFLEAESCYTIMVLHSRKFIGVPDGSGVGT